MARLKQLEINGFKSFANSTTFVFDRGITAIIGPNGSGKSNVAEALRWVLGEQQYSNLRGRRTEDVIFAGSDRRGRLGMSEVSLTIDNDSGVLPIEFSEVTVTRRAHRSGENQYLINGNRVRLKDLQQLTAPLGQAHTIVGQGLVDAVLSQRPEDRRGLFEHAAGITGLRMQALSAERGLLEADENSQRLRDIVGELDPRVRSLARRARQAEQYESVRKELAGLQRAYYGALWVEAEERLGDALAALDEAEACVAGHERTREAAVARLAELRARERGLAAERQAIAGKAAAIESELAGARHALALARAEAGAAEERAADQQRSRAAILEEQAGRESTLAALDEDLAAMRSELESLTDRHAERAEQFEAARRQRRELEERQRDLDRRMGELRRRTSEVDAQLAGNAERRAVLARSRDDLQRRVEEMNSRIDRLESDGAAAASRQEASEAALRESRQARDDTERALDAIERELRARDDELRQRERDIERRRERLDLLERIWAEGEGLHAGVAAVLRAARGGDLDLPGLLGTIAEAVEVPAEVETAIEVALGGHLQDVIVRAWKDAETGIDYLKREKAGRARFQPLDTVRARRQRSPAVSDPGVIDRAANLVRFDPEVGPVVDQLLGGVLIVADLDAAHRIAGDRNGWTIVTLQGELVAPSGSVTGGARLRAAGLLARERERRSLPGTIAKLERAIDAARTGVDRERRRQERLVGQLERIDAGMASERTDERLARERRSAIERELAVMREDIERAGRELATIEGALAGLEAEAAALADEREELLHQSANIEGERGEIAAHLDTLPTSGDADLATLTAELATLRERVRSAGREREALVRQIEAGERAAEERQREIDRIDARRRELETRAIEAHESIECLETELAGARAAIAPTGAKLDELASAVEKAERDATNSSDQLREAERARDRALLDLARAEDATALLAERIRDDLEIDNPCDLSGGAPDAPPDAERRIRRLRERLRHIGLVGEEVLAEYEEESARLDYLSGQLGDVEGAAESLRGVLANLRRQMTGRFSETFEEVAAEFEATFQRLFGGGAARLSHELDGADPGGIDIVARPPGKRLQGLNQLSGGERALTAVALLIAIQRVNPSPFCLLDEVDAALDESNVIRFRQELRELARDTQYIVITHNRGTIEGADTLYGITMGDDSVSRVLSLRLDQAIETIEEDRLLEMESVI